MLTDFHGDEAKFKKIKNKKNGGLKKTEISFSLNSQFVFRENFRNWFWVSMIN
jgi:hypothetical protein